MIDHAFKHRGWEVWIKDRGAMCMCFIRHDKEAPVFLSCEDPIAARRKAVAYINKTIEALSHAKAASNTGRAVALRPNGGHATRNLRGGGGHFPRRPTKTPRA
jgi:hypothetical protein